MFFYIKFSQHPKGFYQVTVYFLRKKRNAVCVPVTVVFDCLFIYKPCKYTLKMLCIFVIDIIITAVAKQLEQQFFRDTLILPYSVDNLLFSHSILPFIKFMVAAL